jgi:hypothetical protein
MSDRRRIDVAVQDRLLVVAVLGETLDFLALDRHGALVLLHAVAVEDAHFDDRAEGARRHAHGGVANVRGLFAEDGAQKLFFRRHRAFALRRDLADQDVARLHFRADIDDAGFVEVLQRFFRDVRNVARDFLRPSLVSRAMTSNSSMWIEVKTSSATMRSRAGSSPRSCSRSTA